MEGELGQKDVGEDRREESLAEVKHLVILYLSPIEYVYVYCKWTEN